MDFMTGLTAAGQALDLVKGLREIDRDLSQAELRATMADLYGKLADVRIALADAQLAMREKDDQLEEMRAHLNKRKATVERGGYTFEVDDAGQAKGRPFCPNCMIKGIFIRPERIISNQFVCPSCKANFRNLPLAG